MKYNEMLTVLDRIYEDRIIEPERAAIHDDYTPDIAVFPMGVEQFDQRVSVTLASGLIPPPEFKYIAWGMIAADDARIVAVGRTDEHGHFDVPLSPGRYRVRYVAEVSSSLDRQILEQLGDDDARAMLAEARAESIAVPRVHVAQSHTPLFEFAVPIPAILNCGPEESDLEKLPDGISVGLSQDQQWVVVHCPFDEAGGPSFPFGTAIVEFRESDQLVRTWRLIPIARNEKQRVYQGRIAVTELLPHGLRDCEPGKLHVWEMTDQSHDWLQRLTPADVEKLLEEPFVSWDPQLSAAITQLKERVANSSQTDKEQQ